MKKRDPYGFELIMDLHECNVSKFNRKSLKDYFAKLCKEINMKREKLYFWDDIGISEKDKQTSPQTKGTSAVQFILTSTIVVHTLDILGKVYVNIFSCKSFDRKAAEVLTKNWFESKKGRTYFMERI